MIRKYFINSFVILAIAACSCSKNSSSNNTGPIVITPAPAVEGPAIEYWLTKGDQSELLQKQTTALLFKSGTNTNPVIEVDSTQTYQSVDGFGYTLTSGSATLINGLPAASKAALLRELFGNDVNSISINYLRISIGASDLSASVYTYNDRPAGQTDTALANFSLAPDMTDVIPLLKEILVINPAIKILATPWTPPSWMKDNNSSIGGSLKPEYYGVYARYFVKYIQQMKANGITIDAITPQNEPLHPGNNPSMLMTAVQQTNFIKNNLGPAFIDANITTKIISYDHNCDKPEYPLAVLADPVARSFVNGSAFHLYAGDIGAMSTVKNAHPDKDVYFTEQWTSATGNFGGDMKWHLKNVIIGSMRNWSKVALEWNLASDQFYRPHTPGGCTECKGALIIDNNISRNVAYYIIAHASKFVPAGSVRIGSDIVGSLQNVAFKTPSGKKVLIVENDGSTDATFNIKYQGKIATTSLTAGSVATYTW